MNARQNGHAKKLGWIAFLTDLMSNCLQHKTSLVLLLTLYYTLFIIFLFTIVDVIHFSWQIKVFSVKMQ